MTKRKAGLIEVCDSVATTCGFGQATVANTAGKSDGIVSHAADVDKGFNQGVGADWFPQAVADVDGEATQGVGADWFSQSLLTWTERLPKG